MFKTFCDRCKKDISSLKVYETVSLKMEDQVAYATEKEGISYSKTLCPDCATDFMNILDFECNRFELKVQAREVGNL